MGAYTKKQKGRNIRIPVWSIGVIEKISASTGKVLVEFKYSDESGQHAMKGTEWFTKDQLDKGLLARASEAQKAMAQQKLQQTLTTNPKVQRYMTENGLHDGTAHTNYANSSNSSKGVL